MTLITEAFRVPAVYRAKSLGMPGLKVIELSHPLASKSHPEVTDEISSAARRITQGLMVDV